MSSTNIEQDHGSDWWRSAVIYQVYPRSFYSNSGQGIGDLAGVAAKADYLQRLGVDIVWLSPFFKSPMKDYGYDVSDYCDVDPLFGSLDDFDRVVEAFHSRGLKIMIDQVYNHTSDQHSWFVESRSSRDNPRADWYVWHNPTDTGNPPNNWLSVFSAGAWTWSSERRQYYLHQFLSEQPDLNFNNHAVQKAILDAAEFWLKRKVDGFRLDTVSRFAQHPELLDNPPFAKGEHTSPIFDLGSGDDGIPINPHWMQKELYNQGQPETLAFLRRLRTLANRYDGRLLLGELGAYNENELQEQYTAEGDALHIAYSFALLAGALTPSSIAAVCEKSARDLVRGWPCWSFGNHDVVRALTRNDAVSVQNHARYAKLLLTVLLALRGTPCLYQGEELGLSDQDLTYDELQDPYSKRVWPQWRGRDGCRTPIPWEHGAPYGGFSREAPWLPMKENHLKLAVDVQEKDANSTLNFYRAFLLWRKQQAALCGTGALQIEEANDALLCFVREGAMSKSGAGGVPSLYCAYNFSDEPQSLRWPSGSKAEVPLAHPQCAATRDGDRLTLPPYGTAFIEL